MIRLFVFLCLVLLSCVAVPQTALAADSMAGMPGMSPTAAPMHAPAPSADSSPWRDATFGLAILAVAGLAVLNRDRRPATIAVFAAAAVVIAALAFFQAHTSAGNAGMTGDMNQVSGNAPVPVTIAQLDLDPPGAEISAPANVTPYLVQTIVARVPGILTDFSAYTGDHVSAGQMLARLDEPELQSNAQAASAAAQAAQNSIQSAKQTAVAAAADVGAARARVEYWNQEIARERSLLSAGAVSPQDYQDEKAQAASAQSAYEAARAKAQALSYDVRAAQSLAVQAAANAQSQSVTAGYTGVVAPDDAVVMKRLVDPGTYVTAGTPILQIAVVNRLRVQALVAQQDLAAVQMGTPIDVVLANGKTLHGRVNSVSPVVDAATHTSIAEAIVQNDGAQYQPGAYVRALLHTRAPAGENAFSVPSAAIVGGERSGVWIDVRGTAHRIAVNVLADDGTTATIRGDLHAHDRVIVTGAADLQEGQPVTDTPQ